MENNKKNLRLSYLLPTKTLNNYEGYLKKQSPSLFKRWQVKLSNFI